MSELAKRTPGTPLSEAEYRQRRDAARARWGSGAIAGAVAAGAAVGTARAAAAANVKEALQPVRDARLEAARRMARHAKAQEAIERGTRGKKLIPTALRSLKGQARRADADLRSHMAVHAEPFEIDGEVHWASTDAGGERERRARVEALQDRHADLAENAVEPRRVKVPSSIAVPKVETYERVRSGKTKVVWSRKTLQHLTEGFAAGEHLEPGTFLNELGVRNQADLDALVRQHGKGIVQYLRQGGLSPKVIKPTVTETVRNRPRIIPAHTRRVEGYPDDAGRAELARQVKEDVRARSISWATGEADRAARRIAAGKATAKLVASRSLRTLGVLRNPRARLAAVGIGALFGGLAGWSVKDQKLAKAAGDETESANQGTAVENSIAERLARVFRSWKDDLTADLLSPRQDAMTSTMLTGLDHAMLPLRTAGDGGAAQPIPGVVQEADTPKDVTFTFEARSPTVQNFVEQYRKDRIAQLLEDQKEAIKTILIDAAKSGMSPDEMARRIRGTIGLTANQAQQVLNYQAELEDLEPKALGRQLRDKRYDSVIQRAIDENRPLSAEQIQRMVDAYHRKYLAYRAMTIARTEGVGAANNGHVAAVEDFLDRFPGYTVVKTWIATEDERTRPDHIGLHEKSVVGLHTPFVAPSGDTIRWPHDPEGAAHQVINCRCSLSCRLVPRRLAAELGTKSVSPLGQKEPA